MPTNSQLENFKNLDRATINIWEILEGGSPCMRTPSPPIYRTNRWGMGGSPLQSIEPVDERGVPLVSNLSTGRFEVRSWLFVTTAWPRRDSSWWRRDVSWLRRDSSWPRREVSWSRRDYGVMIREHGVLIRDYGVMIREHGVTIREGWYRVSGRSCSIKYFNFLMSSMWVDFNSYICREGSR